MSIYFLMDTDQMSSKVDSKTYGIHCLCHVNKDSRAKHTPSWVIIKYYVYKC